ncbi:MAG: AAA family ATPase [Magnetococcales bacterium]|nr:AAA family ATPase [Magnetococcales bacterium]
MAISLASLNRQQALLPPRILVYGVAGVGKSTLAACAPKPVFILTEDGLGLLQVTSFPISRTFGEVLEALDSLLIEQHDFESVVMDSVDWLEPLIWAEVCRINRAVGTGERGLFTQERPAFLAKNRYGLPPEMSMEWSTLEEHLTGKQNTHTA